MEAGINSYFQRTPQKRAVEKKRYIYAFIIISFISLPGFAQVNPAQEKDKIVEDRIENIASSTDAELDFTEIAGKLEYYAENKINLNKLSAEELEMTGLFTSLEASEIIKHREQTGPFFALEELQTLDGFSKENILKILPYITVKDFENEIKNSVNNIIKYGKHRFTIRTQQYLEKQNGYEREVIPGQKYSGYLGSNLKLYTQYQYRFARNFSFNITAEKDAGEQFFDSTQKNGFDFYSAHLAIGNIGIIKKLVIGDYQLEYGQGLTLWTGLGFGKSPEVINVKKNSEGISPYYSVNEYFFKRGAAISLGKNNWQVDLFYSKRKLDANVSIVNADTIADQITILTSFLESGYHRTISELADKGSLTEKFYGGHASYKIKNFKAGITSFQTEFSSGLIKDMQPYNIFSFKTEKLNTTGIDYSWLLGNINLFGEVSRNDNGAIAYLNGAMLSLGSSVAFSVVNRNYARDFFPLYSNAFAEGSTIQNEKGTYFGIYMKPVNGISINAYYDAFSFPWLRYQVNAPSNGHEWLSQITYTPSKQLEIYFRTRQTNKQINSDDESVQIDYLVNRIQNNYRFNIGYKISKTVSVKSRVEGIKLKTENSGTENGYMFFQDLNVNPFDFPLQFVMRYGLFDTKSYYSRIYTYENDVPGSWSIPSFYYRGSRYYLMIRYTVVKGVDIWLRYAQTAYANQNAVGSGLDEINGNRRSEIKMQLRLQF